MKTYSTPACLCPSCGYATNKSSNMTGKGEPRPKDYTICLNCGELLRFTKDLKLVVTEIAAAKDELNAEQLLMVAMSQKAIRERGPIDRLQNARQ